MTSPLQLLLRDEEGQFVLNESALREVVDKDDVRDRHVVAVSVVGAFRKGKSFLINFLLRFLNKKCADNWVGNKEETIQGFEWKEGAERNTEGILMWPHAFLLDDNIALLLFDTQGLFDRHTTIKDNNLLFSLPTLISSVQIFNVMSDIQLDHLQNLQTFLGYANMVKEDMNDSPFHTIVFLVRDWKHIRSFPCGFQGGEKYLDNWVKDEEKIENLDRQSASEMINSCFSKKLCFLMPHPGETVDNGYDFKGTIGEIKDDFVRQMKVFVEKILSPDCLAKKRIGNDHLLSKNLPSVMKAYLEALQSSEITHTSLLESTANVANNLILTEAKNVYFEAINASCSGNKAIEDLKNVFDSARDQCLAYFDGKKKFGGPAYSKKHRKQLEEELESHFVTLNDRNEERKQRDKEIEIQTKLAEAREGYNSRMATLCSTPESVPELIDQHDCIKKDVLNEVLYLEKLCSPEDWTLHVSELEKWLEEKFKIFQSGNDKKKEYEQDIYEQNTISTAKQHAKDSYRNAMDKICGGLKSVENLEELNTKETEKILSEFDITTSSISSGFVEETKMELKNVILEIFNQYKIKNEEKKDGEKEAEIKEKMTKAYDEAIQNYDQKLHSAYIKPLSEKEFTTIEKEVRKTVLVPLNAIEGNVEVKNKMLELLQKRLDILYETHKTSNLEKQKIESTNSKREVIEKYEITMSKHCEFDAVKDLSAMHKKELTSAVEKFTSVTCYLNKQHAKEMQQELLKILESKYSFYESLNNSKKANTLHVQYQKAKDLYLDEMEGKCKASKPVENLEGIHNEIARKAKQFLVGEENHQLYKDLEKFLNDSLAKYKNQNQIKVKSLQCQRVQELSFEALKLYKNTMKTKLTESENDGGLQNFSNIHKATEKLAIDQFTLIAVNLDEDIKQKELESLKEKITACGEKYGNANTESKSKKLKYDLREERTKALTQFNEEMDEYCSNEKAVNPQSLINKITDAKNSALGMLLKITPDAATHSTDYNALLEQISKRCEYLKKRNDTKLASELKKRQEEAVRIEKSNSLKKYKEMMRDQFKDEEVIDNLQDVHDDIMTEVISSFQSNIREYGDEFVNSSTEDLINGIKECYDTFYERNEGAKDAREKAIHNSNVLTEAKDKYQDGMDAEPLAKSIDEFTTQHERNKNKAISFIRGSNVPNELRYQLDSEISSMYTTKHKLFSMARSGIVAEETENLMVDYISKKFSSWWGVKSTYPENDYWSPIENDTKEYLKTTIESKMKGCDLAEIDKCKNKTYDKFSNRSRAIQNKLEEVNEDCSGGRLFVNTITLGIGYGVKIAERTSAWRKFLKENYPASTGYGLEIS